MLSRACRGCGIHRNFIASKWDDVWEKAHETYDAAQVHARGAVFDRAHEFQVYSEVQHEKKHLFRSAFMKYRDAEKAAAECKVDLRIFCRTISRSNAGTVGTEDYAVCKAWRKYVYEFALAEGDNLRAAEKLGLSGGTVDNIVRRSVSKKG